MNRNILTFLNEYAEIPDPQYAIMLRGAWGCGKTFFIRQWMEQLKNNRDADKLKWQPIYVSLYGLTTTQQITEQINVKEDNRLLGRFILMFEAAFRSP